MSLAELSYFQSSMITTEIGRESRTKYEFPDFLIISILLAKSKADLWLMNQSPNISL